MTTSQLLFTRDIEAATAEIEDLGGRVTHRFSDRAFVAEVPESADLSQLTASTSERPGDLDAVVSVLVDAWELRSTTGLSPRPAPEGQGLNWDAPGYESPREIGHGDDDELDDGRDDPGGPGSGGERAAPVAGDEQIMESTGTPTSLYMVGSIAVGIVVVGGPGDLAFSSAERAKVVEEVQEGLDFLANAEPRARITWVYDVHFIDVTADPGPTDTYEGAEAPWRNAALVQMGFPGSRAGSRQSVADLRTDKGTDWAFVGYFTKYPLRHFAYASVERTTMHYDNDGWGHDSINRVFAHEACHIFGAADEYGSCNCGGSHGHLGAPNNNCVNCTGDQEPCLMSGNVLQMCSWSRQQIGWDESLFPGDTTELTGRYTIRQKSSDRFLDAHEGPNNDWRLVTRQPQNNDTQRWILTQVGMVATLQQRSSGRFLDAYTSTGNDFSAVTRPAQENDTQRWVLLPLPGVPSASTIQQLHNGRFLDAHVVGTQDFSVVTRTAQDNDTQRWLLHSIGGDDYTIRQRSNGRFLDAHEENDQDFSVVTRTDQQNDTQRWTVTPVAGVYTLQQASNGRLMDAHEAASHDYSVVSRITQSYNPDQRDTQRWVVTALGDDTYTLQQLSTARYLDAYESSGNDFKVITRTRQNNDTQRWIIEPA